MKKMIIENCWESFLENFSNCLLQVMKKVCQDIIHDSHSGKVYWNEIFNFHLSESNTSVDDYKIVSYNEKSPLFYSGFGLCANLQII